jgi:NCAIR mutase (PurE)-related protein
MEETIRQILDQVATGKCTPQAALNQILGYSSVGNFAKVDTDRLHRQGFPEVVLGLGKTAEQIITIMESLQANHPIVMATRIEPHIFAKLQCHLPQAKYYPTARIATLGTPPVRSGKVTILTAGTGDIPVAEEAAVTVESCGFGVEKLWDVGVAGIHRLLCQRELIQTAQVLIVVAGMDGALVSVVGGLARCPVIGVPTSVGYGTSFGGIAALLTMLNSCSAGVGIVNIDNGFGAGMLAARILGL